MLLGFSKSNMNFLEVARSLEDGGTIIPWKHVKSLVLCLIFLRSCRIVVQSDYESKPVPVQKLVHYNIFRADDWSSLRLAAVVEIDQGHYYYYLGGN